MYYQTILGNIEFKSVASHKLCEWKFSSGTSVLLLSYGGQKCWSFQTISPKRPCFQKYISIFDMKKTVVNVGHWHGNLIYNAILTSPFLRVPCVIIQTIYSQEMICPVIRSFLPKLCDLERIELFHKSYNAPGLYLTRHHQNRKYAHFVPIGALWDVDLGPGLLSKTHVKFHVS